MKLKIESNISLMQQALGEQWNQLPPALKAHYDNDEHGNNNAIGKLTINYPKFMQLPLSAMRLMGALVNQQGEELPTTVKRVMIEEEQYWHRTIHYPDGKKIAFKSRFTFDSQRSEFIEYTNQFLGMRMRAFVKSGVLYYESCGYVINFAGFKLSLPEWLALGHASIVESAVSDTNFKMDFRLKHPLLGEIFSYIGEFETL